MILAGELLGEKKEQDRERRMLGMWNAKRATGSIHDTVGDDYAFEVRSCSVQRGRQQVAASILPSSASDSLSLAAARKLLYVSHCVALQSAACCGQGRRSTKVRSKV